VTSVRAYLGLGSNLGDRLEHLREAVPLLARRGVKPLRSSRVYETEPVGGPQQPDYLNAVLEVETSLVPRALLKTCLEVEADLGRTRGERWGPRVIDIDVLTYGSEEIAEPGEEAVQGPVSRPRDRFLVVWRGVEREPGQERLHVRLAEFTGMGHVVEPNEIPDPIPIGFLGSRAVTPRAHDIPDYIS
jgi:2-amino-4-hydroxy-6-hydroxymethyldihydropteridine diphosphokinase